jgi:excisionase family DNA binding protein
MEGHMTALEKDRFANRLPTKVEIQNAEQLRSIIAAQVKEGEPVSLALAFNDGETRAITLMPSLTDTLLDILRLISSGRGFRMMPVEAELTTQEAADLLNVSRPYLIKVLEKGDIPFVKVGRHRRIRAEDLFAYKAQRDQDRSEALAELAAMDVEDDLV